MVVCQLLPARSPGADPREAVESFKIVLTLRHFVPGPARGFFDSPQCCSGCRDVRVWIRYRFAKYVYYCAYVGQHKLVLIKFIGDDSLWHLRYYCCTVAHIMLATNRISAIHVGQS